MTAFKRIEVVGGAIVCACLFFLIGGYIYHNIHEERSLVDERRLNEISSSALAIKSAVLGTREIEKELFLTGRAEAADALFAELEHLERIEKPKLEDIETMSDVDLTESLARYLSAAASGASLLTTLGLDHNSGLEGKFRNAVHTVEREFQRLDNATLLAHLMYLRRYEKDFMMRLDPAYLEQFQSRMSLLQSELLDLGLEEDARLNILSNLNTYGHSFTLWTENRVKLQEAQQTSDAAEMAIVGQIDRLISFVLGKAEASEKETDMSDLFSDMAVILTGILGLVFSFILVRMLYLQRRLADEVHKLAHLDVLTQLANRRGFTEHLSAKLAESEQCAEGDLIVGIVDLDGFKGVNDVYGHAAGDELLKRVATRLRDVLPADAFIGRLGGDEFGIVANMPRGAEDAIWLGHVLCESLDTPFDLSEGVARVGASIGFTTRRPEDKSISDLLERADYALYQSKQNGKGKPILFSDQHESDVQKARQIERLLLDADLQREITIAFQPIVDPATGNTIGMEALARWHNDALGVVAPSDFICIAEQIGIINDITEVVLEKSLKAATTWPEHVFLSVNLSALDIATEEAAQRIVNKIMASSFQNERLFLEVTETILMNEFERSNQLLDRFRQLGVKVALDDFGTGYSSLGYLSRLPIDLLKIDRSFMAGIEENATSRRVLNTIVSLCSDIEVKCIIEGVERESQQKIVSNQGSVLAQGFLYSRPMNAEEVAEHFGLSKESHLQLIA
ncbi:MAG: EAL domain-containing protein [Pseudomonadota bacterium]